MEYDFIEETLEKCAEAMNEEGYVDDASFLRGVVDALLVGVPDEGCKGDRMYMVGFRAYPGNEDK